MDKRKHPLTGKPREGERWEKNKRRRKRKQISKETMEKGNEEGKGKETKEDKDK